MITVQYTMSEISFEEMCKKQESQLEAAGSLLIGIPQVFAVTPDGHIMISPSPELGIRFVISAIVPRDKFKETIG